MWIISLEIAVMWIISLETKCHLFFFLFFFLYPGEYIASGSDDGRWFIWEKKTGRLLKMLHGDDAGKVTILNKSMSWNLSA